MMMMVMMLLLLHNHLKKLCLKVVIALKGIKDLFSRDLIKRSGNDCGLVVVLTYELDRCLDLALISLVTPCKDYGSGVLNLIDEELAEVLDIYLGLSSVYNCHCAVQLHVVIRIRDVLNRPHYI